MASERTVDAFFARAARCETRFAEIYAELSSICASLPAVATFWDSFAKDEILHADLIRDIQRSLTPQQLSASPTDSQWNSLRIAERLLERPLLQSIEDLDDAYELAHEIENCELMPVFQLFLHEAIGDAQLEAFIKAQLDEHICRLEGLRAQCRSAAARRDIRFRKGGGRKIC